jgi:hypothetical protein
VIRFPEPDLQIEFSRLLDQIRSTLLQEALSATVKGVDIAAIDGQLGSFVPKGYLSELASRGLRGELVFAVPVLLAANPRLVGYYRLLYGFSQKAFYNISGVSVFKSMETKGTCGPAQEAQLSELCSGLIECGTLLIAGIGADRISREHLDDLTRLTVGPQLRGSNNVNLGAAAIVRVFEIIHKVVAHAATETLPSRITLTNAAGRKVFIEFASDPDIIIREVMPSGEQRNIVAIEVKGGTDFSNIHNRIGEAEKSHQKAKNRGFVECWTVLNVDRTAMEMAKRESPTTNRFYLLSQVASNEGEEYIDFVNRVVSLTGIAINSPRVKNVVS